MNSNIEIQVGKTPLLIFLMLVILVEIILSDIFRIDRHNNSLEVFLLILCAFVVFLLQFSTLNIRTLEDEIEVIKELYSKEIEQYKFSHSMMDMINLKYHDIRHQIRDIGQQAMMSKEVISELEDAVGVYDSLFKTDNVAIDVILAEKSLICQRHHITLSCIVDGKQLNFLKEAEIYSLFGNLLDNAIRAVMDLPVEMRMISLSVKKENDFITICEYNYFKGDISFSDGLPLTSKKDSSNHGYGTRSVLYTAEKYGGTASFYTDHQIFYANIIFLL
ncbi:MAG: ATP-binding protein [Lachnospiraceae bacterium]|nr:ATP-binding protein [Lachnospiraceae bacterium]